MNNTIDTAERIDYKSLAAEMAEKLGAETFPVQGKQPALGYTWRTSSMGLPGVHQANVMDISGRRAWDVATGYGVAPCQGSRLAILDIDNPQHDSAVKARQIVGKTLTVKRGDHLHIYIGLFRPMTKAIYGIGVLDLTSMEKKEAISLRGAGAYVVGPGSKHLESGGQYEIAIDAPVAQLTAQQTDALFDLFHERTTPKPSTVASDSALNPKLLSEIVSALEAWEGRSLRFSQSGTASLKRNPFRSDDPNRSSYFSSKTGWIHDQGAGGLHYSIKEVCDRFGINIKATGGLYRDKQAPAAPPKPAPAKQPRQRNYFEQGIPDVLRTLLLSIDNETGLADQAPALATWELWHVAVKQKLITPADPVDAPTLIDLAQTTKLAVSRHTIIKGLAQLAAWGISLKVQQVQAQGDMGATDNNLSNIQTNPMQSGRKAVQYRFRKLNKAIAAILRRVRYRIREFCMRDVLDKTGPEWFGVFGDYKSKLVEQHDQENLSQAERDRRAAALARYEKFVQQKESELGIAALQKAISTPLPSERQLTNGQAYRDSFYLARVRAAPGRTISRINSAKEVGRSACSVSAMAARAGVERIAQYSYVELEPGKELSPQIKPAAFRRGGTILIATDADGDYSSSAQICPLDNPKWQSWVSWRLGRGQRVFVKVQEASKEVESGVVDVPKKSVLPSPSKAAPKHTTRITVWRRFNPEFVRKQLAMRNLEELADGTGLRDLKTGEVFRAIDPD